MSNRLHVEGAPRIRPSGALAALILAIAVAAPTLPAAAQSEEPSITYPLAGVVQIWAPENAVAEMLVALYGTVTVDGNGNVTGAGVVIYDYMQACDWEPPRPDLYPAPYCRIDGVADARFTVSGAVVDTVHRHDDDNIFKDHIFALADAHSDARLDYAPLTLSLTLTLDGMPTEQLAFWGFSEPTIQPGDTQAATLGLLVSGVFDTAFEITPVAMFPIADADDGAVIAAARQYVSSGDYHGGTPVTGSGSIGFVDIDPSRLPTATNPSVYLGYATEAPRDYTAAEQAAMAAYEAGDGSSAHDFDRDILDGGMQDLFDGLRPFTDASAFNQGAGYSPYGLTDQTRAD